MLKNYLKSTLRNLSNKKSYTAINLAGLTLGLICFSVISYWVFDELNYDRFHTKSDRIYRVTGEVKTPSDQFKQAVTSPPLGLALRDDLPSIENVVRFDKNDAIVESRFTRFKEDDILLTDPAFFEMFDFSMIEGNPEEALKKPYSIVLSKTMAEKYFGYENPLNQTIKLYLYDPEGKGADYAVTGIIEDAPENSHIQYNFLISFSTMETNFPNIATGGWFENFIYTYVLLKNGAEADAVADQFPAFIEKHMGDAMDDFQMFYRYDFQPFEDIYLHSDLRYDFGAYGDFQYVIIFATIGFFILLLAGINYINLSTAFAIDRLKDASIRKVSGATKSQLVLYYLFESITLIAGAFLICLVGIELFNPTLSSVIGKEQIDLQSTNIIYFLAGIILLFGLLSGLLPSLYLSSVEPVYGLKQHITRFGSNFFLRKALVVFQFTITIMLLIGILVINSQLDFIKQKNLGFDKNALITLNVNGSNEVLQNYPSFKQNLLGQALISHVARSNTGIGDGLGNSMGISQDIDGNEIRATVYRAGIDYEFIPAYGLTLIAGRNFSQDYPTDSTQAFIVNEAAVKTFGWNSTEQAIGQPFQFIGRKGVVVGVVKNFNFNSLHKPIEPVCLYLLNEGFSKITLRTNNTSHAGILLVLESAWKQHFPGSLFEYNFVDDHIAAQYKAEQQFEWLLLLFSILSFVIACIGIYGLAGFSSKRRKKEIGIRKVLGATISQLTLMLNKEYLKLLVTAFLVGSAGAWLLMQNWLGQFAYRTELGIRYFVIAGGLAILITLVAVSGQSIKAAMTDPVKTLRNE